MIVMNKTQKKTHTRMFESHNINQMILKIK